MFRFRPKTCATLSLDRFANSPITNAKGVLKRISMYKINRTGYFPLLCTTMLLATPVYAAVTTTGNTSTGGANAYIGDSTAGTMTIDNGSTFSKSWNYIGNQSGAVGVVTVRDPGSAWTNSGRLYVGSSGTGTLNIENGGLVSDTESNIGLNAGSIGTVIVTGTGSTWTNSSSLYVGNAGAGTLTIEDGGTVSATSVIIGNNGGTGTGTVTVSGIGLI